LDQQCSGLCQRLVFPIQLTFELFDLIACQPGLLPVFLGLLGDRGIALQAVLLPGGYLLGKQSLLAAIL